MRTSTMRKLMLAGVAALALGWSGGAMAQQADMSFFITSVGLGKGAAIVGHHDRQGLTEDPPAKSWNASHPSRGCSQDNLRSSGGAGLLYCFATN